MNSWIKAAVKQQKKIKSCDNSKKGHDFKFSKKQTIMMLEGEQTWDLYICSSCGLGQFR